MAQTLSENPAKRHDELSYQVERAAERCRESGSVGDLVRLRDLRVLAGEQLGPKAGTAWDGDAPAPPPPDLFADAAGGIPEIDGRDLDIAALSSAMHHHGALILRNMISPRAARGFRHGIDNTMAAANAHLEATKDGGEDTRPTAMKADYMPVSEDDDDLPLRQHKAFLGKSGAIETFLSPRLAFDLFDCFERLGFRRLLQAYFRDEPCVSFKKSVLRRAEPLIYPAEWHQDGAFMTTDIKSVNVWIALSECGGGTDSPGMDLLPKRLNSIVPTGINGAAFNWSVSGTTVTETFPDLKAARPYFAPGDAILFDHYNLHATSSDPAFTKTRYAIETWFFAKSRCAINQHPVYW
ncbi:MAG: hypothetical protein AAF371_12985 [Pseudomonadota bacterium]